MLCISLLIMKLVVCPSLTRLYHIPDLTPPSSDPVGYPPTRLAAIARNNNNDERTLKETTLQKLTKTPNYFVYIRL